MGIRPVRNSAKAIIIRDGSLLTVKLKKDADPTPFFILPGGGQEPEETFHDAVKRECREEIGAEVEVGDVMLIREYIGKNHEFAHADSDFHGLELMFVCTLAPGAVPRNGSAIDLGQIGVEWLPLAELDATRFYPKAIRSILARAGQGHGPIYLGDVN